jgi:hypothetical protein
MRNYNAHCDIAHTSLGSELTLYTSKCPIFGKMDPQNRKRIHFVPNVIDGSGAV